MWRRRREEQQGEAGGPRQEPGPASGLQMHGRCEGMRQFRQTKEHKKIKPASPHLDSVDGERGLGDVGGDDHLQHSMTTARPQHDTAQHDNGAASQQQNSAVQQVAQHVAQHVHSAACAGHRRGVTQPGAARSGGSAPCAPPAAWARKSWPASGVRAARGGVGGRVRQQPAAVHRPLGRGGGGGSRGPVPAWGGPAAAAGVPRRMARQASCLRRTCMSEGRLA